MKITQQFIDDLSFKGGWKVETINNKSFYVLNDPNLCQIFWLEYWYTIGAKAFANQNHIPFLNDGDIRNKVTLNPVDGEILMAQESWSLIFYLGNNNLKPEPPIVFYISPIAVIWLYIIFVTIVLILYYTFATKNTPHF